MVHVSGSQSKTGGILSLPRKGGRAGYYRRQTASIRWGVLAAAVLLAPLVFAQGVPRVTGIEPASGKVNDSVTVKGENLDKSSVSAAFLSDDKSDYKATVVEQNPDKIVIKVPQVKSGDYNISIQAGNSIFIQPVRFKVE
jgi:hypothetical protein